MISRVLRPWFAVGFFLIVGCAVRLREFAYCRSLWLDEAMLATSIAARSAAELLRPLEYNQNAPILFLWLTKLCTVVLGINEWALRAVPQISGWLLLIALTLAARRAFGEAASIACASLAALSPALTRYANEAKPYGVDAFVTSVLLLTFVARRAAFDRRSAVIMGAVASVSVILSHPAVFTTTALWVALAWAHRRDGAGLRRIGLSSLPWILVFTSSYLLVVRPAAGNELLRAGYSTAFLPPHADSARLLPLMISGTLFPAFGGEGVPTATAARSSAMACAFVAGLAFVSWYQGGALAIALGGPVTLAFAAAGLGLYPVGVPRLMMFQSPCVLLLASGVIGGIWPREGNRRLNRLGLTLWLLILWPAWANAWTAWNAPFRGDDFRGAYNEYAALQLGEPVYVSAKAQPAWLFYSTNWSASTRRQRELFGRRLRFYFEAGGQGPSFENRASRGGPIPADEGRDLVFDFRGRSEILGISAGRQWKWPSYVSPVDAGWPEHEAARVRAAAVAAGRPCEWIIFERISELTYRPLRNALRFGHGGRAQRQLSYPGVTIAQICHG